MPCEPDSSVVIELIHEDQASKVLDFLDYHFFPCETLFVACGLNVLPPELRQLECPSISCSQMQKWLQEEHSLAAINQSDGSIIGLAINILFDESHHQEDETDSPFKLQAIFCALACADKDYNFSEITGAKKGLELLFLGVHENYSGRGLAQQLTQQTIQLARDKKLSFIKSNPTSPKTFHILEKHSFDQISRLKLSDISLCGTPCFPLAKAEDCVGLMVLNLSWLHSRRFYCKMIRPNECFIQVKSINCNLPR